MAVERLGHHGEGEDGQECADREGTGSPSPTRFPGWKQPIDLTGLPGLDEALSGVIHSQKGASKRVSMFPELSINIKFNYSRSFFSTGSIVSV